MKKIFAILTAFIIVALVACGGGGGGSSSTSGGDGGDSASIKEEIRLGVLSANSLAQSVMNSMDDVLNNAVVNFDCDFSASVSTHFIINNSVHNAYASGQVRLYNNQSLLACDYFLNSDSFFVQRAEIEGSGYVNGNELNSTFQGKFDITGSSGFLAKGNIFSDILLSDYFFINGSGTINDLSLQGIQYPDISGNLDNVKVNTQEAWNLFERIMSGGTISFGDVARALEDGYIDAQLSDCSDISIHFNGSNLVDVASSCTVPTHFKVNVDTGAIVE